MLFEAQQLSNSANQWGNKCVSSDTANELDKHKARKGQVQDI